MQFENYHGQGDKEHHGSSGPVGVSKGTHTCKEAESAFIDAADMMGYHELKDLQNLDANNGTERWMKYIAPNGRRSDAAHMYIHPKLQSNDYPNLHVLCEKQVIRVLLDEDKRAVGVEYQTNAKFQFNPEYMTAKQTPRTVRARKMIVCSAGANGTPLILERSGVGDPKILERAGVPVKVDLPGVGNDYQDHHLTLVFFSLLSLALTNILLGCTHTGRTFPRTTPLMASQTAALTLARQSAHHTSSWAPTPWTLRASLDLPRRTLMP